MMNRRDSLKLMLAACGSALSAPGTSNALTPAFWSDEASQQKRYAIAPAFEWLRMGEVKPAGWIKEQMLRDLREGFAGKLGKLCHEASSDIFVTNRNSSARQNTSNQDGVNWWNGETEGNWRTGYIMMAYLSEDAQSMKEADEYVRHILASQDADGYLGVFAPDLRYKRQGELWTQACLLRGLLAYAELTSNQDVMRAVIRAADHTVGVLGPGKAPIPWGENHDLMIVDVLERLFDLTGDVKYGDFALWLYRAWSKAQSSSDTSLASLLNRNSGWVDHGVHTYETIRVPLWLSMTSRQEDIGRAYRNAIYKLNRYTEPGGSAVSEEWIKDLSPDPTFTEYEYCATKEIQYTLESALQKTGQAALGDRIERVWFNDAQGSRLPDGRAISYLTNDNRLRCDGVTPDGVKPEKRNKFSPAHTDVAVCCNPNATQVAALYVRGMWMRHQDGGLAALLYGPCAVSTTIGNVRVHVEEKTQYPFEHEVRIDIQPEREVEFPLYLRDPGWSRGTTVRCTGAAISRKGEYWVLRKKWKIGDVAHITFAPSVQEAFAINGEVALQYGPLLFAHPIESERKAIRKFAIEGFEDSYFLPKDAYEELALPAELQWQSYGFQPVNLTKDVDPQRPFDRPLLILEGEMVRKMDGNKVSVTLVPLGNAPTLRCLTFPIKP